MQCGRLVLNLTNMEPSIVLSFCCLLIWFAKAEQFCKSGLGNFQIFMKHTNFLNMVIGYNKFGWENVIKIIK